VASYVATRLASDNIEALSVSIPDRNFCRARNADVGAIGFPLTLIQRLWFNARVDRKENEGDLDDHKPHSCVGSRYPNRDLLRGAIWTRIFERDPDSRR